MKKRSIAILLILLLLTGTAVRAEDYCPADGNTENLTRLLSCLLSAYTAPRPDAALEIDSILEEIRSVSPMDKRFRQTGIRVQR